MLPTTLCHIPEVSIFCCFQVNSFFLSFVHIIPVFTPAIAHIQRKNLRLWRFCNLRVLFPNPCTNRKLPHLSLQGPQYSTKPHGFLSFSNKTSSAPLVTWNVKRNEHVCCFVPVLENVLPVITVYNIIIVLLPWDESRGYGMKCHKWIWN